LVARFELIAAAAFERVVVKTDEPAVDELVGTVGEHVAVYHAEDAELYK